MNQDLFDAIDMSLGMGLVTLKSPTDTVVGHQRRNAIGSVNNNHGRVWAYPACLRRFNDQTLAIPGRCSGPGKPPGKFIKTYVSYTFILACEEIYRTQENIKM